MAKPSNDDFLGNPGRFNKVGDRGVLVDEPVEITAPPDRRMSARTIVIIVGLIVLLVFLVFIGENGFGGIQHRAGRGRGISTEGADKARQIPSNF